MWRLSHTSIVRERLGAKKIDGHRASSMRNEEAARLDALEARRMRRRRRMQDILEKAQVVMGVLYGVLVIIFCILCMTRPSGDNSAGQSLIDDHLALGFVFVLEATGIVLIAVLALRSDFRDLLAPPNPLDSLRCRRCGYDLRGSPTRCPECGTSKPHPPPKPMAEIMTPPRPQLWQPRVAQLAPADLGDAEVRQTEAPATPAAAPGPPQDRSSGTDRE